MVEVSQTLHNVFTEPEPFPNDSSKKESMADKYRKRYQLLGYDDVMKLRDVMETPVPIHGKGNFPTLEVTPSTLVQMVRDGLTKEGIRVPNVRLNGSAATHVLSEDGKHPYKDLDLIFAVDLSSYGNSCDGGATDMSNNSNDNLAYCRSYKMAGHRQSGCSAPKAGSKITASTSGLASRVQSPTNEPGEVLSAPNVDERIDGEILGSSDGGQWTHGLTTALEKTVVSEEDDTEDKESGYTSSGSSVASLPHSLPGCCVHQDPMRSRTHSLDSSSSVTSSSSLQHGVRQWDGSYVDFHSRHGFFQRGFLRENHDLCDRPKDSCWQKIKEVVMRLLRDLLPAEVTTSRMTDVMLTDAYVQKMVKITNDADRWSLFSLNNDAGRNLELKFVVDMRRQYEFSVDSFQIILDSYLRYKLVSRTLESTSEIKLAQSFFPSVLAESVYGDFEAALRHLRNRRICTKRPEEIRGGGLLRYCNLRVRDFTPGEVEGHEDDVTSDDDVTDSNGDVGSHSTSKPEDIARLEHLMCSRFFIDFGELPLQQQKVMSYLEGHFRSEEDLKFQFLLIAGRVVERGTVCLMSNEKSQIVAFIKQMALETLAKDVKTRVAHTQKQTPPSCAQQYRQPNYPVRYQPCSPQWNRNDNNNCQPQFAPPNNYAPANFYPSPPPHYPPPGINPTAYPHYAGYSHAPPPDLPIALCPHCRCTYPPASHPYCMEPPSTPQIVVTPPQHTMSVTSAPFYPAPRDPEICTKTNDMFTEPIVYLSEHATLIYSAGPPPVGSGAPPDMFGSAPVLSGFIQTETGLMKQ